MNHCRKSSQGKEKKLQQDREQLENEQASHEKGNQVH